jgi:FdhD protein
MATVSACTSLAAQRAEEYNLTLVGYLRGKRMTIYTCPERVVGVGSP